jgi:low temperature requirement protein LtrA
VVGIIFIAVAAKKTLEHPGDPLSAAGRWALGIGAAVYLSGSVLGRLRAIRSVAWERAIGAAAALAAVALLTGLAAVAPLAVVTGTLLAVVVAESLRLRELRRSLVSESP